MITTVFRDLGLVAGVNDTVLGKADHIRYARIFLIDADGTHPRTVADARGGFYLSSLAWLGPDEVLYAQTAAVGPVGGGTRGMRHNLRTGETRQVFSNTDITSVVDVLASGRVVFDAFRPSRNLRETDLRTRMQEYIPVGLEYGIFYET